MHAKIHVWRCRCEQAQELCRQREAELAEARLEADALRGALDAERAAADAAATALTRALEQQHAADKATVLGDAMVGYRQQLQEQREQLEKELASQSVQLEVHSLIAMPIEYLPSMSHNMQLLSDIVGFMDVRMW